LTVNLRQSVDSFKSKEPVLFTAAILVVVAILISVIRFVIVIVRYASFDPSLYDEEEMMIQGFVDLYSENADFTAKILSRYSFAQSPVYIRIMFYSVIILFALAFLIMYIKVCREWPAYTIPGILFILLMPSVISVYVVRTITRGGTFGNVPNWVLVTGFIIALIALVVMGYFTLEYNDDIPIVNAKFFLISASLCCLIIPGLSYILIIGGVLLGLFLLSKACDFVSLFFSGPSTVTIIDNETGESFTVDKDNVKFD